MDTKVLLTLGVLAATGSAPLSGQRLGHAGDHVLNDRGQGRITLATGIPYIAIGEYAYGVSDRVTVGILAGLTPNVAGYGVRARAIVYQPHDGFRVYACAPVLFYPHTRALGGDAWWLTRPNINFEWIRPSGFRYKVGGSVIAAASHHSLFGDAARARFQPGVWQAVHGGISLPIGRAATLQVEASVVLDGLTVADRDWVGGPPVILVIGTSWRL